MAQKNTIAEHHRQIKRYLKLSPSLLGHFIEGFDYALNDALKEVGRELQVYYLSEFNQDIEVILNEEFRHK